jgi:hypothetical protein
MVRYWKLLGEYDAETTSYSNFAGSAGASPYTPTEDAHLIGLRVTPSAEAATSLLEAVQFKLTCATFKPNSIEVGGIGNGLRTAPATHIPYQDWVVDQHVKAGVPITLEGRNIAGSNVTVHVFLWALLES